MGGDAGDVLSPGPFFASCPTMKGVGSFLALSSAAVGTLKISVPIVRGSDVEEVVLVGLLTVTQSGSGLGVNGFAGRRGFGIAPGIGGLISDFAGCPLAIHHLL